MELGVVVVFRGGKEDYDEIDEELKNEERIEK
jgi:hypothetical protein